MTRRQRGPAGPLSSPLWRGVGLHSGEPVEADLQPGRPGEGVVFVLRHRGGARVRARPAHLVGVPGGSELVCGPYRVRTPEHLLAGLAAADVTDVEIHMTADEVPGFGDADEFFCGAAATAWPTGRPVRRVTRTVRVELDGGWLEARPSDRWEMAFTVDYPGTSIGRRIASVDVTEGVPEVMLRARTFCLLEEVEALRARGMARGGSLDDAVVFGPDGPINPDGLRDPDEPAWHKLLDLYGDLAVLGANLRGRFEGHRSGHRHNAALVHALADALSP